MSNLNFSITKTKSSSFSGKEITSTTGNFEELLKIHSSTLNSGAYFSDEKGCKKINTKPKTIKSLVNELNKASFNLCSNVPTNVTYTFEKL